jgi:hypothetical protein
MVSVGDPNSGNTNSTTDLADPQTGMVSNAGST